MIKGLYTSLITPFTKEGNVDYAAFNSLISHQIAGGVTGILLFGQTGEVSALAHEEKRELIKAANCAVKDSLTLMVCCGTESTTATIEQMREAEFLGATRLLVNVPNHLKRSQIGIYQHFKKISSTTRLPIVIYDLSKNTNLEIETLQRLVDIPSIVSYVNLSGDILWMNDLVETVNEQRKGFSILSGEDAYTLPLFALGGHGCISTVSNIIPKTMNNLVAHASKGNFTEARTYHHLLKPLIQAICVDRSPSPIKYMLECAGLANSTVRPPFTELTEDQKKKIHELLHRTSCTQEEANIRIMQV